MPIPLVQRVDAAHAPGAGRTGTIFMLTRERSRLLDRLAQERYGLPALVLMENAALCVREAACELLARSGLALDASTVVIACGPGNNGGDGLAAARHLANSGAGVRILLTDDVRARSAECATHLHAARAMGLGIETWREGAPIGVCDLMIDALFGTGLSRPLDAASASLVEAINSSAVRTLAVDVPSGLDADAGTPLGGNGAPVIRADVTLALGALKPGLIAPHARRYVGELFVGDIGVPRALLEELGAPAAPPLADGA